MTETSETGTDGPPSGTDVSVAAAYAQLDAVDVPFLRDVAVALVVSGHDLDLDVDLATVEVEATDPWVGRLLGVVRPLARSVTFYAVHPDPTPVHELLQMVELAVRLTDAEFDVTFEVDLATGAVAARTSVTIGEAEVPPVVLGTLLGIALENAEEALRRYRGAIDAVSAGELGAAAAHAQARADEIESLLPVSPSSS